MPNKLKQAQYFIKNINTISEFGSCFYYTSDLIGRNMHCSECLFYNRCSSIKNMEILAKEYIKLYRLEKLERICQ